MMLAHMTAAHLVRSRAPRCRSLPPRWHQRNFHGKETRAQRNTAACTHSASSFVLLWSTNANFFTLRARRCIESIFYHHRWAIVRIYTNELPAHFFHEFAQRGFDIRVRRYNVSALLQDTPASPWLARLTEWERGPNFYAHITDAIRLALLFSVGGIYLDTDVILTRPVLLAGEVALGQQQRPPSFVLHPSGPSPASAAYVTSVVPALRDALGVESYADPRTGEPTLNGAFMAFERRSRYLWNCLHEFAADYQSDRWSWNGPELLTRVRARCADSAGARVQVEPPERFYPLHWDHVADYADGLPAQSDAGMWHTIRTQSYAVHVWNRKTSELTFKKGSLLYWLHNTWTVLPGGEACT